MKKAEQANFPQFEEEMLKVWEQEQTFRQSLELRRGKMNFSFYDGPPFANGLPHFGHSLVTSIKDALGRYKTMRGYYVERRNGWDCHGLPVEFAIEREFGISGKKEILELGLDKFNAACRASVFKYKHEWEELFHRIGRWSDTENAYATIDTSYTESVWWVLSQLNEKGLLYRGYKSMPYCPRCQTPLSNFELNEGYKDGVKDPSVFVKFELADKKNTYFLAWTTTPWTLPANAALAVDEDATYVTLELVSEEDGDKSQSLIVAEKRLDVLDLRQTEYKVIAKQKGAELTGLAYKPLFEVKVEEESQRAKVWRVYSDPSVSLDDGTGILHIAPRYGESDLALGQRENLPLFESVDAAGRVTCMTPEWEGLFFKEADPKITANLTKRGLLFAAEIAEHTYPFCYRCDTPLLYFAISTWFISVTSLKDKLIEAGKDINWVPAHIKEGRFGKWLEGARDWAISRNRYWGAPMPVWVNERDENDYIVIESIEQLKQLAPMAKLDDLHRPYIDEVIIHKEGKTYKRVEEVLDCWFESGSMPVAQQHYPFENAEKFNLTFPADYIGEGLDQTRLWFYVLHVISTALFDKPAYKNVLVNGMIMASDGQKLSKRLKNYPPVEEVFAQDGADALRLYLLSSYQAVSADYLRFNRDGLRDVKRNVLMTLWNTFSFFSTYAEIDGWKPDASLELPKSEHLLDKWILARLNQTVNEVTQSADKYQLAHAINPIFELIDDTSNWYVRRSRRRFWKSEDDTDKKAAYATLHYVLVAIAKLLAPWAPFVSDKMYRELTAGMQAPQSVHLCDWPEVISPDTELLSHMSALRARVNEALSQRARAGVKVRQPLGELKYSWDWDEDPAADLQQILAEEVNVKRLARVKLTGSLVELDTALTPELEAEGMARDLVRFIQSLRKEAGLEVHNRIRLAITSESGLLNNAVTAYQQLIKGETLAETLDQIDLVGGHSKQVKVGGHDVTITLKLAD